MPSRQPPNPYQPPQTDAAPTPTYQQAEVEQRIKDLNTKSFLFGVPGMVLQGVGGNVLGGGVGLVVLVVGTGLLIYGLTFYARSRGQHPGFAAFGLLSLLGLIVLSLLAKKCIVCGGASRGGSCMRCDAPVAK